LIASDASIETVVWKPAVIEVLVTTTGVGWIEAAQPFSDSGADSASCMKNSSDIREANDENGYAKDDYRIFKKVPAPLRCPSMRQIAPRRSPPPLTRISHT
jgi:hypothetical protein